MQSVCSSHHKVTYLLTLAYHCEGVKRLICTPDTRWQHSACQSGGQHWIRANLNTI